jgi:cell division protein FtsW (lipid II flippase)
VQRAPAELDGLLLWPALGLLLLGLVMVYSSSIAMAEGSRFTGYQPAYFLFRHSVFLAIGLIAGITAFQIPLRLWQQASPWLFLFGFALLMLVLIPHVGRSVNGAQRWIGLGPVNLQPSELMKLFVVLYAADYTTRKLDDMGSFVRGFGPMALVMVLVGFLLLKEPDFGAFVVILAIATGILFLGGINVRIFGGLVLLLAVSFVIMIWASPYRRERIFGFMDPWQDAYGKGYQLSHALIAFGRGEWFGVGLGASVEKAVLPARGAHRFPARGDCRGTRLRRRVRRGGDVCPAGATLLRHRPPGPGARPRPCRPGGAGRRHLARRAGLHQHGREHGPAADQGPDPAADELRRLRHRRQLPGPGDTPAG